MVTLTLLTQQTGVRISAAGGGFRRPAPEADL